MKGERGRGLVKRVVFNWVLGGGSEECLHMAKSSFWIEWAFMRNGEI